MPHRILSRRRRPTPVAALSLLAGAIWVGSGEAHKPITSPFTFNEDVFPIMRERCGGCHVGQGVAPMSLMTHAEAVPWGESMRLELIAGHMPPWSAFTTAGRLQHTEGLTARELNILLTWASGGTPIGGDTAPPAVALTRSWPLGAPDVVLPLPEFAIGAESQAQVAEFVVAVPADAPDAGGAAGERWLRAVDLLPGTPALVRSATVSVRAAGGGRAGAPRRQPDLLLWQPGLEPARLSDAAFRLPAGAELLVRVRYKKTWEYERKAMTDRSVVGLYLTTEARPAIEALEVTLPGVVTDRDLRVLAVSVDPSLDGISLGLEAARPDNSRDTLIAFRPQAAWRRRFWFEQPVLLPKGTRLGLSASTAATTRPRVTLDVIPD